MEPPPSDANATSAIDRSLVRGIAWTGGVKWLVQVVGWAATLVVVRHVTPAEYGLIGSASLCLGLLTLVSDVGIGTAVIKLRALSDAQLAQLNGAAAMFGVVAMGLSAAIAVPAGWFFRSDALPAVLALMSVTLAAAGLRSVPSALLQRAMRFRDLAYIEAIQALVGAMVTIVLAVRGWGAWALAIGAVAQAVAYTVLTWRAQAFPLAWPQAAALREPLALSGHVLVYQLAWWTYSNADFAIAGRLLGASAMGAYLLAWEFANLPVEKITNIVTRVTPSVFSALQHDPPALRRQVLLLTEGLATLTLPASIGLALVAGDFVALAFGPQWTHAVLPLQLLSVYVSLRSVQSMLPQLLVVTGDAKLASRMGLVFAIGMPAAFVLGARWGTTGIAAAWLLVYPVLSLPYYQRTFERLDLTAGRYMQALRLPLAGTVVMAGMVLLVGRVLPDATPLAVRLAVKVFVGGVVYVVLVIWPQRERLQTLVKLVRG